MSFVTGMLNVFLVICSLFLICLVLIQRGKGGGLAGAFGGVGGSSAFGTKAGDVFTKVTMYVAGIWIAISMLLVILVNRGPTSAWGEAPAAAQKVPATPGDAARAGGPPGKLDEAPPGSGPVEAKEGPARPLNPADPTPALPPPIPPGEAPRR